MTDIFQPLSVTGAAIGGRRRAPSLEALGAAPAAASYFTSALETAELPNSERLIETGSFTVQMTGFVTPFDSVWEWTVIGGRLAVLYAGGSGLAQSNADLLEIPNGTLPAAIRPRFAQLVPCTVVDNNIGRIGRADIASSEAGGAGGIAFATPVAGGALAFNGFSPTGLKGIPFGAVLIYPLL